MILYTNKHKVPFQIDDEYEERVKYFIWGLWKGYPATYIDDTTRMALHIFLFGYAAEGLEWDHINRDILDNRRENLRQISHGDNIRNQKIRKDNKTGVTGIRFFSKECLWGWQIEIDGIRKRGYKKSLEEALTAKKVATIELQNRRTGSDK